MAAATVTDVRVEQIAMDSGFSSLLYRLHLTAGDDVPPTLIAKLPAQSEARGAMELLGGYRRELAFYQSVAGRAPIATPRAYAARMAEDSVDFILLLEDLQAWDNADHLAGLAMNRARLCIEQLAGLHAWSTDPANTSALEAFPSIDTPIARDLLLPAFAPGWQVYLDNCSRLGSGARCTVRRRVRSASGGGTARADRTRHAATRRHPRRQPVLRRRRDEGRRLPVRCTRLRCG